MHRLALPMMTVSLLALTGCNNEPEINRYQVERPAKIAPAVKEAGEPVRMLAAIAVSGDKMWFFKLQGKEAVVAEPVAEAFGKFIRSVRFTGKNDPPVTWDLPEGWKHKPGVGERFATLIVNAEDKLELTVFAFPKDANTVLDNVNRWRGQIGLAEARPEDMGKVTQKLEIAGVEFVLLDMIGRGGAGPRMPPFAGKPGGPRDLVGPDTRPDKLPFTMDVPKDWNRLRAPGLPRFTLEVGAEKAVVTITPLAGEGGSLLANVNRWRGELDLEDKLTEAQLPQVTTKLDIHGTTGHLVDVSNPQVKLRTTVVMFPRAGQMWFIKMIGHQELVGAQKNALEAFARSLRFEEAK